MVNKKKNTRIPSTTKFSQYTYLKATHQIYIKKVKIRNSEKSHQFYGVGKMLDWNERIIIVYYGINAMVFVSLQQPTAAGSLFCFLSDFLLRGPLERRKKIYIFVDRSIDRKTTTDLNFNLELRKLN